MAEDAQLVSVLKLRIKEWEHSFRKQNSRLPSRDDIKKNPSVCDLYKAYKSLKEIPGNPSKFKSHTLNLPSSSSLSNLSKSSLCNTSLLSDQPLQHSVENSPVQPKTISKTTSGLGPTPQANGKVISILDFNSTPPDSSPLKPRDSLVAQTNASTEIFKTPTKPASRVEQVFTPVMSSSKRPSLSQKLAAASQEDVDRASATPQYLGRVNRRFEFTSPAVEPRPAMSLPHIRNFTTPTKSVSEINFLISPSPLKSHRFMHRKLKDVFYEMQQEKEQDLTPDEAALEEMMAEMEKQKEQDGSTTTEAAAPKRKKFTQKRTTRRFKIKARYNDDLDNDQTGGLTAGQAQPNQAELSEAESDDSQEEYVRPEILNPKGRAPGATNFQRLRINDPRTRKFKRRMANRRF